MGLKVSNQGPLGQDPMARLWVAPLHLGGCRGGGKASSGLFSWAQGHSHYPGQTGTQD